MLRKISQILYVFLGSSLILFLFFLGIKNNLKVDEKIVYLFILVLLPLLEPLINLIKKDSKDNNLKINFGDNLFKYLSLIILSLFLYFYGVEKYNFIILIFFTFSLIFRLDSRISFLTALILLFFTPVYLIIDNKKIAELLSINAYYFLIIGILLEIKENIFQKKKIEENNINFKNIIINELKVHKVDENYFNLLNTTKNYFQKVFSKNNLKNIIKYIKTNIFNIKSKEDDFSKNLILFSKIIGIILIYKLIENNWEYFTIKNLIYLLLGIFVLFILKNLILNKKNKNINGNYSENKFYNFIKSNSKKISYIFFILSSILSILIFKYNLIILLKYSIIILIIFYIFSLFDNKQYLKNTDLKKLINKSYFFNKAIFFSSLGLISSYLIFKNIGIKEISTISFFVIFIFYFIIFYFIFYKANKKEILKKHSLNIGNKFLEKNIIIGRKVKKFSPTNFIKNNIYTTLNIILIFAILITYGVKSGFFKEFYFDHINKIKAINFLVIEDKKVIYKVPVKKQIELIKKRITSGEAKIKAKTKIIKISEYYKFNNYLRKGYSNNEVSKLKDVLTKLGYFNGDIQNNNFDEKTRLALVETLKKECDWPKTTKGILGKQAQNCINNLNIKIEDKLNNNINEKINIISGEAKVSEKKELIKVSDYYRFKQALSISKNKNPEVKKLEEIMKKLGYFDSEPDLIFDEKTRLSLVKLLQKECQWPKTTKGILGYKAQLCLYNLKIEK